MPFVCGWRHAALRLPPPYVNKIAIITTKAASVSAMAHNHERERPHTAASMATLWWRVLRITYLRFCYSGTVFMAAAIAFFSVICLGPLGIIVAAALQRVLGPGSNVYEAIHGAANDLGAETAGRIMPQVDGLLANPDAYIAPIDLHKLLTNPGAYLTGLLSIAALLWAGLRLFETVERSLTEIWPGKVLRGYFTRKVVAFNMMLVAGMLLASFMVFNSMFASIQSWAARFPEIDVGALDEARPRFLLAYQLILAFVAFGLLYRFMPVQRVPSRVVVAGAACAAVIWFAASQIFTHAIGRSNQYGAIYGGLAGVVVFSLWTFLGAQALLIGGHFAVAYEHVFLKRRDRSDDDTLSGITQRRAEQVWVLSSGAHPTDPRALDRQLSRDPRSCEVAHVAQEPVNGVIIAGGRIAPEFAQAVGSDSKGLIDVLGKPCVEHVVDAMRGVPNLHKLVLVGPTELYAEHPVAQKVDAVVAEGQTIVENLDRAIDALGADKRILMAVSDTPLLTSRALCEFLSQCPPDAQLCYPVTRREDTERLFGDRVWVFLPLKEGWITHTCNMLFDASVIQANLPFISKFVEKRRNQWTAAGTVGIGFLLRFALSWYVPFLRYSMPQIAKRLERITGAEKCAGVIMDYPEMALDIDKPTDVEPVEAFLRKVQKVPWPPSEQENGTGGPAG